MCIFTFWEICASAVPSARERRFARLKGGRAEHKEGKAIMTLFIRGIGAAHKVCMVLLLLALAGCAVQPNREALRMDGYVGGRADDMVRDKGVPTKTLQREGGGQVYVWRNCRLVYDWYGEQWPRYCETKAVVDAEGIVRGWSWRGNECPTRGVDSGCETLPLNWPWW